jgi:hypothetical protein
VALTPGTRIGSCEIVLVENFFEELKRLVPVN